MPRFGQDPVYTGEQDAPELLSIPLGDALRATASETFGTNPTEAVNRAYQAQTVGRDPHAGRMDWRLPFVREQSDAYRARYAKPVSPVLTMEQAQAKIDAAGLSGHLKPTEGQNDAALSMLIDYKTRELGNKFILDRYRGGVAGGVAQLATGLAVSLADPVNIGSAFMPVVGEARYAQLLGRAGTSMTSRAAVRTGVGAVEGTVGAALVEPIIYQSKQAIQADYTAYDSLANIGFGGLFGGVLQPGAGAVADVFARRARTGAWDEAITPAGERELSDLPEGWISGGGTRYIDGDDYVRGQFAVVDAAQLPRGDGESFAQLDPSQVFESPYSDSGAPVFRPDGTPVTGSRRLAAVVDTYAAGAGDTYRAELIANAERYGLDSEAVEGLAQPVLVRTETSRATGKWAQDRSYYESTPQARAAFANPDEVVRGQFRRRARELGVPDEAAEALAPSAARDSVTGFYDGRTDDAKTSLLERAQRHVAETGDAAVLVSGDIFNLGGLNAHVGNRAEVANVHFRAMANLMREELDALGGDVVPMRTGGDELGAVVIGADRNQVDAALERARSRISEYASLNDLADIPHPKRSTDKGVGMHFGAASIDPRLSVTEIANAADSGVDLSKQGIQNVRASTTETTGGGTLGPGSAGTGTAAAAGGLRKEGAGSTGAARISGQSALKTGIAQAVNGREVTPGPAALIDGTRSGAERFLEAQRIADEAVGVYRARTDAQNRAAVADLARFDPAEGEALDAEVKALEMRLRNDIKAAGGDESSLDAALAEVDQLTEELDVESKALRATALCMLRGG
jgi:GGDEF domain-containing protein